MEQKYNQIQTESKEAKFNKLYGNSDEKKNFFLRRKMVLELNSNEPQYLCRILFLFFDQWAICCWWNYWRCYKFTDFFLFVFYWQKIVNYMNNNPLLFRQWSLSNIM